MQLTARSVAIAVALAALGAGIALAPATSAQSSAQLSAQPSAPAAAGRPELGPLISGTSSYVDGTYAWTDYAYDDRGANTNGIPGGDTTYPANPYPGNTAD